MVCRRPLMLVVVVMMMMMIMIVTMATGSPDQQRLRDDLFNNYDKETMPSSPKEAMIVTLTNFIIHHLDMHEETHRLHVHAVISFTWRDYRLRWDPDDYSGIHKLTINPRDLWLPDISFYNAAEAEDIKLVPKNRVLVDQDGNIIFVTPVDLSFFCVANLTYWPNDVHECRLKILSWMFDGFALQLMVEDALTTEVEIEVIKSHRDTMDTLEWQVVDSGVMLEELYFACCNEPYFNLQVILILHRDAPAYTWLIKAPAACLILATLVVFVLPPGAGEKITFGGLCLLLNLVFLLFTHNTIRNSPNHTPLLVQLVVGQLAVTATSVLIACWVVRAAQGPYNSSPPSGVHSLSLSLAPALGLSAYIRKTPRRGRAEIEKAENGSEGESCVRDGQSEITAQWILLGAVLDRIALGLYLISSLVMLIRFLCVI